MEKLTPFIMAAIFILISFGLLKLTLNISSVIARRKILSYGRPSEEATAALLCSYFGTSNVMTNIWLPYIGRNGKIFTEIDDIVILPSCIAVVEVKSHVGRIYSDDARTWHQSAVTRDGEPKEEDFINPVLQNERHAEALRRIFEREKFDIPKIHNIVIFTSRRVVFTREHPEVFTLDHGIEKLRSLTSGKKLTVEQKYKIIRIIKKYSAKPKYARAYNNKNLIR